MQRSDFPGMTRAQAYEASEDRGRNPTANDTIGDIIHARFGRRGFLKGALGVTATAALLGSSALIAPRAARAAAGAPHMGFEEISHGVDETHHVAKGYSADILIRWGDPVLKGAPDFDPMAQSAKAQSLQFGYNNDYIGYLPLEGSAEHGLLCVNHEYTSEELMFPGLGGEQDDDFSTLTYDQVEIELAAHGASILEVKKDGGKWAVVPESRFARRITGGSTYMRLTGPAAGHDLLKTSADPAGTTVIGMLNNCAGGMTPWGTFLSGEENFHGYFWGNAADGHPQQKLMKRYGVPGGWYGWGRFVSRFNVNEEPNEANRFGWVVEIDPTDPTATPKKRTAMGRFKHEGAEILVNKDGRVVAYMGDDERFEYTYRFVSAGTYDATDRAANMDLLDAGTLSVARFNADGSVEWLDLVQGQGPLTAENGFATQGDVVIKTRLAADLLGATKMDRPEDVEAHPSNGRVYVLLTNNSRRKDDHVDAANPRAGNTFGHVIEMVAPAGDHTAPRYSWEILVKCGNPAIAEVGALWNPATSANGWFASPDNCAFDAAGNFWISTDQGENWAKSGTADGIWAVGTDGENRGLGRMFFRVPIGAEMCGPCFTADGRTLFLAVQHPAADGAKDWDRFARASTFEDPATRWPDFQPGMPPRPAIVAITKDDGGVIGS
jgi:secreted PhoX family phosphatase